MFYVYILESQCDKKRYIGYTHDLRKRIQEHNKGKVFATRPRRPLKLIYYEACIHIEDAKRRERYFKQTGGRRFLEKRLREYYKSKLLYWV